MDSLYVDVQGYVPALLENLCGMSCSKTYWLLGGGWFQCRYGGFWVVSYYLKFHGVRRFLVFSGFGLVSCLWISVLFVQESQDFFNHTVLIIKLRS